MSKPAICPWCNTPISFTEQFAVERDGEYMHLSCADEEDEDATFDSDMEFGS